MLKSWLNCKETFTGPSSLVIRFTYFHFATFVFPMYNTCYIPHHGLCPDPYKYISYLVIQTDHTDMVVIVVMYVYSLRVGGFRILLHSVIDLAPRHTGMCTNIMYSMLQFLIGIQ